MTAKNSISPEIYESLTILLPKGAKKAIKELAKKNGEQMGVYCRIILMDALSRKLAIKPASVLRDDSSVTFTPAPQPIINEPQELNRDESDLLRAKYRKQVESMSDDKLIASGLFHQKISRTTADEFGSTISVHSRSANQRFEARSVYEELSHRNLLSQVEDNGSLEKAE